MVRTNIGQSDNLLLAYFLSRKFGTRVEVGSSDCHYKNLIQILITTMSRITYILELKDTGPSWNPTIVDGGMMPVLNTILAICGRLLKRGQKSSNAFLD